MAKLHLFFWQFTLTPLHFPLKAERGLPEASEKKRRPKVSRKRVIEFRVWLNEAPIYTGAHAMKSFIVFLFSLICSALMLSAERAVGIGWDFHPDSVTYATASGEMMAAIREEGILTAFNNGYYVWSYFLGMNVVALTFANMVVYSLTNVAIYRFHALHVSKSQHGKATWLLLLLLLLLNPYRLHLSTTVLKDTFIIFLVMMMAVSNFKKALLLLPLAGFFRLASPLYLLMFAKRQMVIAMFFPAALVGLLYYQNILDVLLTFNEADMQLREFDRIPTFQEFGLVGVLIRSATWPLLAITGLFVILSPAAAFFPVALGSIFNQLYIYKTTRSLLIPAGAMLALMAFGAMVTGFTAYIRYVYPLLVALPIVVLRIKSSHSRAT